MTCSVHILWRSITHTVHVCKCCSLLKCTHVCCLPPIQLCWRTHDDGYQALFDVMMACVLLAGRAGGTGEPSERLVGGPKGGPHATQVLTAKWTHTQVSSDWRHHSCRHARVCYACVFNQSLTTVLYFHTTLKTSQSTASKQFEAHLASCSITEYCFCTNRSLQLFPYLLAMRSCEKCKRFLHECFMILMEK